MESALAEAKQVQEILGEYHEGTHVILEKASSAAEANAERPGDGRMKHISVEYGRMLSRTKKYVCTVWQIQRVVLKTTLATLKIELTNPQRGNMCINMITAKSMQKEQMNAHLNSASGVRCVKPSTGHKNFVAGRRCYKNLCEHRDGLLGIFGKVGQVGKVGDVGKGTAKWMQSELTKEQESVENEFQDVRKIVVTDAVANLVAAMSKFMESEGGTKQVEKVVKDAHEVGGVFVEVSISCGKATPCCSTRHEHSYHTTTLHWRRSARVFSS